MSSCGSSKNPIDNISSSENNKSNENIDKQEDNSDFDFLKYLGEMKDGMSETLQNWSETIQLGIVTVRVKATGTYLRTKNKIFKFFGIKRTQKPRPPAPATPSPSTVVFMEKIGLKIKKILGWGGEVIVVQIGDLAVKYRHGTPMAHWVMDNVPWPGS